MGDVIVGDCQGFVMVMCGEVFYQVVVVEIFQWFFISGKDIGDYYCVGVIEIGGEIIEQICQV